MNESVEVEKTTEQCLLEEMLHMVKIRVMSEFEDDAESCPEPVIVHGILIVPPTDDGYMKFGTSFLCFASDIVHNVVADYILVKNVYGVIEKFPVNSRREAVNFLLEV